MMGATLFAKPKNAKTTKPQSSAEYNIVLYGFIELDIG
jgi:hypothetical protein